MVQNIAQVESHSARELGIVTPQDTGETSKQSPIQEELWLPKLEETSKRIKTLSGEIMRYVYGISSELDIWSVLLRLDEYLSESWEPLVEPNHNEELLRREASKIVECIQESQASNAVLWTPLLTFYAVSIFKWKYPALATILQGKREFQPKELTPTNATVTKLYRYERQIGDGRYSSVWIVESRQNHRFYALKKIPQYSLDKYERSTLQVNTPFLSPI